MKPDWKGGWSALKGNTKGTVFSREPSSHDHSGGRDCVWHKLHVCEIHHKNVLRFLTTLFHSATLLYIHKLQILHTLDDF